MNAQIDKELLAAVEAALYAADEPVRAERLAEVLATARAIAVADVGLVQSACLMLEERLRETDSALQVVEIAGGYRLGTRPALDDVVRTLKHVEQPAKLSIPLLETLAIVAYRQPATTAEIQSIRGRDPGSALRRLRDMGMVKVTGRRRAVGRPFTFGTTEKFLEVFGLRDLEELPAPEEFQELLEG
jgi:segregation and condensation protein B